MTVYALNLDDLVEVRLALGNRKDLVSKELEAAESLGNPALIEGWRRHLARCLDVIAKLDRQQSESIKAAVVTEKCELDEKLQKLTTFTTTLNPTFASLPPAEWGRLIRQREIMESYSAVLGERIQSSE